MSAAFTRDDVVKIAALAHLDLNDTELDLYARQLADILAAAEDVQRVDTTGVPPTAGIGTRQAVDRADDPQPSLDRSAALANAPDAAPGTGFFRVPRVLG